MNGAHSDDTSKYLRRFSVSYVHLSCLLYLLESIIWERESELSETVLTKLIDMQAKPMFIPPPSRITFMYSLFCVSLPFFGTSKASTTGIIPHIYTEPIAFSLLKSFIHNWTHEYVQNGKNSCFCSITLAMKAYLEKLRGVSLSKYDSINLILSNDWIWGWGFSRLFGCSSLLEIGEGRNCAHKHERRICGETR